MSDLHFQDLLPAYALGILDDQDSALVEAHLQECDFCQEDLLTYQGIVNQMSLATPLVDPPDDLKQRILTEIDPAPGNVTPSEKPNWRDRLSGLGFYPLSPFGIGSGLLIIALFIGNLFLWNQIQTPPALTSMDIITMEGTDNNPIAEGLLIVEKGGHDGTLVVNKLEPLGDGQLYQLWLIEGNNRSTGGVFSVTDLGYGWLYIELENPLPEYTGFGITIEPTGGSFQPTGNRVLRALIDS